MSGAVEVKYSSRITRTFPKVVSIQLGNLLALQTTVLVALLEAHAEDTWSVGHAAK